ncbi:MAG: hypothetical protein A2Y53_03940 [Chloroflexi bacterium RBG_16_47_49]|nr:MAG: hypothetical protein A2Y53_03940 [Chloroflexi bacterium RBG_16_47_49]
MPDEGERTHQLSDFSGAVQSTTTRFLQKTNELKDAQNARFKNIGGVGIRGGYSQSGNDLTSTTTTSTSTSTTTTTTSTSTSTSSSTSTTTTA